MRTLVVYFSLSGTTEKVAKALAGLLGADLAEIRCDRYRPGLLRYFRAVYDSVKGRLPAIDRPENVYGDHDLLIVGAPIWAGHPAPPIRAFLSGKEGLPGKVALFTTRGGSAPEPAFAELEALLPAAPVAKLALRTKDVADDKIADALRAFVAEIAGEGAQ